MRAQLTISCRRAGILAVPGSLYGSHDPSALAASALARKAPETAKSIAYAARTRGFIVMSEPVGANKLVLYIESSGGGLRQGAEEIWGEMRDNAGRKGSRLKPKLTKLILYDEDANDVIATAGVGAFDRIRREDTIGPVITGVVTAVVLAFALAFGNASPDFFYGSATALIVALLYAGYIVWSMFSKALAWR
jgi:hypothetical protein